jgi:hypothetical protein
MLKKAGVNKMLLETVNYVFVKLIIFKKNKFICNLRFVIVFLLESNIIMKNKINHNIEY